MRTMVCASLVERSIAGVSRSSKKAFSQGADLVELRLDFLPGIGPETVGEAREAVKGPAIATLRSADEGGLSNLDAPGRREALETIIGSGFEYVDLELRKDWRLLEKLRGARRGQQVIASIHLKKPALSSGLRSALSRACNAGTIGKVAMPCEHAGHALDVARAGRSFSARGHELCVIGMGEQGILTRACARKIGSRLMYASLRDRQAGPGQLKVGLQKKLVGRSPVILGLIGHPVSHSVSRNMQEAALERAGLDGIYVPMDFPPGKVGRGDLELLREIGFRGVNVTVPHKRVAYSVCDALGTNARDTGAVNTITFKKRVIEGENTDVNGFATLLEKKKVAVKRGSNALLIGAGGGARAAATVLSAKGAKVVVTARHPERARALARELSLTHVTLGSATASTVRYDVVVNCTPAGMKGYDAESPLPLSSVGPGSVFLDLVYNPPVTRAMTAAAGRGARAYGGLDMLVAQGAKSFNLWTRRSPDIRAMSSAARRALR